MKSKKSVGETLSKVKDWYEDHLHEYKYKVSTSNSNPT